MLEQEYKTLYNSASTIQNWQTMNKNDLINAYIDNEQDETLRSAYFSAIMCRYWGNIGKYYTTSKSSGFTIDDCYSWLVEAIMIGLKYRKWRDSSNPLSKDKNAPDKVINRCIFSRRRYYYYIANLKKNKGEYNKISLDDDEKIITDYNNYMADYSYVSDRRALELQFAVYHLFNCNRWFEGFLLNYIYLNDLTTYSKTQDTYKVDMCTLSQNLSTLSYSQFANTFQMIEQKPEKIEALYTDLKSLSSNKLKKLIKTSLENIKNNKELREALCC